MWKGAEEMRRFDEEIDALLAKMTLKEKIGQLNQVPWPQDEKSLEICKENIRNGKVGSIILASSFIVGNGPKDETDADLYNELQRVAINESPNHIPIIYGMDVIHGHNTVYPVALANAAAFNPELTEKCYRNIAQEASADGIHWTFSPMLDLCRDPRWGRIVEGPGEDPYVGAQFAKATIKGFQGEDLSAENSLAACVKHYVGYGASEGGRDYHRTEISDYSLYNYYLPAFRAAADVGVTTAMSSFNDINGNPITSSKKYLTEILRDQLGFDGFVVSDWGAVQQLMKQGVAETRSDCAKLSIEAGLDMDMCSDCYIENLERMVQEGKVLEKTIDTAVRRILNVKFAKGLFQHPFRKKRKLERSVYLEDAKQLAAESMVLLKNDGVLPLRKNMKVALLGPFIEEKRSLLGTWTLKYILEETPSLLESMCEKIGTDNIILGEDVDGLYDSTARTAVKADVVVLALGESWKVTGECHCLSDISLTTEQKELIYKAKSTGKKVVGVFFCGRPIAMEGVSEYLDAILYAWHSGTRTADAVCDILFGDTVPSGKTAITFPRRTGHIPLYYNVTSSGRYVDCYYGQNSQVSYMDSESTPSYPFGYGLSYTNFVYGDPEIENRKMTISELKQGKKFVVTSEITNAGEFGGKEVVQLYIYDSVATTMRPLRELKGFQKVFIPKGETVKVTFELGYSDLGFYLENGTYTVESGKICIFVGEHCLSDHHTEIEILS